MVRLIADVIFLDSHIFGSSRKCVSGHPNDRNASDTWHLNGRRVPSRRNAEGVVSLMGGGRYHNAEGGLEEKVMI
jgi:hypothetical protein